MDESKKTKQLGVGDIALGVLLGIIGAAVLSGAVVLAVLAVLIRMGKSAF